MTGGGDLDLGLVDAHGRLLATSMRPETANEHLNYVVCSDRDLRLVVLLQVAPVATNCGSRCPEQGQPTPTPQCPGIAQLWLSLVFSGTGVRDQSPAPGQGQQGKRMAMKVFREQNQDRASAGRGRRGFGRLGIVAVAALGASALFAGGAQASTVTIGSVFPSGFAPKPNSNGCRRDSNTALPEGANLDLAGERRDRALADPGRQRRALLPAGPAPERDRRLRGVGTSGGQPRPTTASRPSRPTCRSKPAI